MLGGTAPSPFRARLTLQRALLLRPPKEHDNDMSTLKAAILCLVATGAVLAGDPSGKWEATIQSPRGEMKMNFNLKADGETLTGTVGNEMMGDSEIQDGKISGDDISFKQVMERGERKMTIEWTGKIKGDELELTRSFAGGMGGGRGPGGGGPGGPGARGPRGEGGPGGPGEGQGRRGGMGGPITAKRVK